MTGDLPENLRATIGLRIVEYDLNNVQINGQNESVDVQIWDTSGDEKYLLSFENFKIYFYASI